MRYENIANTVISVPYGDNIHEIYVAATKEAGTNNKYIITYLVKRIDTWIIDGLEDEQEIIICNRNHKIKTLMLETVEKHLQTDKFKYYIERYDEMLECYDIGDSVKNGTYSEAV